jgi:hypothetical protein
MISNRVRVDGEWVAWGTAALLLIHLCYLQWQPESATRALLAMNRSSRAGSVEAEPSEFCDRMCERASVKGGNVWLRFVNHATSNLNDNLCMSFIYFRGSYVLYPRRIYVGPTNQVVNDGRDILKFEFEPGRQWLRDHSVRSVLTMGKDSAGWELPEVEILPEDDGRAGAQTGGKGGR